MIPPPRLLANVITAKAKETPNNPWILYADSAKWQESGYKTITWKQLYKAINKVISWLERNVPRDGAGRQTFAYQGPNDPRYYILLAAATMSKRTMFIPDGRITQEGLDRILKEIKCSAFLSAFEGQGSHLFPSLQECLADDGEEVPVYPYEETWERAKDEIVCIIHTSGTTGVPKPIYLRNGWMSIIDWTPAALRYPNLSFRHISNSVAVNTCSTQWAAGFATSLNGAVFAGVTTVMLPPDMKYPIDPQSLIEIFKHTGAQGIITPPSLIEELYKDPAGLELLRSLKYISWAGAGLSQSVGDSLVPYTSMIPMIGSTERGIHLSVDPEDRSLWNTFEFIPESGSRFEQIGDNLHELFIDRQPESEMSQGVFFSFPEIETWPTAEVYSVVYDKNGSKRYVFQGRKDDLVKLSWLAKFHATHIEDAIAKHDSVKAAVVGGEGREVPYIIIEPKDRAMVKNAEDFIDEIYDGVIRTINEKDDDEIRIPREMVMLTDPDVPFQRTLKMTIKRKEVEKAYENRIDDLYKKWKSKAVQV